MEVDRKPMTASSSYKVEPKEFSNEWVVVRPGRARKPAFEGSKVDAVDKARVLLQRDGGGVIRILDDMERVVEELAVSKGGDVVERRTLLPRPGFPEEASEAGEDTFVILLYACDLPDDICRLYLVLDQKSKEVLAAIGEGSEDIAVLERAGFCDSKPVLELAVSMAYMEGCVDRWGPISSTGIERKGREICGERSTSLDAFATDPRFASCSEGIRTLAAALWLLWDRHLAAEEVQTRDGRLVRISRFLLLIDNQGYVTVEEYRGGWSAAEALRKEAQRSPSDDSIADRVFDPSAPRQP